MPNTHNLVRTKYSALGAGGNSVSSYYCGINQTIISKPEKGEGGVSLTAYKVIAEMLGEPLHVLFAPDMDAFE